MSLNQDRNSITPKGIAPIKINFDDEFEISEDSFKPMTKGLGFHHEQKKTAYQKNAKVQKMTLRSKNEAKIAPSQFLKNSQISTGSINNENSMNGTGLEAFYQTEATSNLGRTVKHKKNSSEEKTMMSELLSDTSSANDEKELLLSSAVDNKNAPALSQAFAFLLDLAVVVSFVAISVLLIIQLSGLDSAVIIRSFKGIEALGYVSLIFSLYFLLYFSIFDLGASPGKSIFNLKVVKNNSRSELSLKDSSLRSLISLLSIVTLFLPLLLDFQGRLTETKVVYE